VDLRQQLQQAEIDMLEVEREWLTKQGPLRDAQLGLAQTRYAVLQQDLDAIKAALGQVMSQESVTLTSTEEDIVRRLLRTTDPVEMLRLKVQLETIKLRKSTAAYRQQVNLLGDQMSAQEKRNEREQQEAEHLESLVKKYARGERIAQRLQVAFTRLRRQQARLDVEQQVVPELMRPAHRALVMDQPVYTDLHLLCERSRTYDACYQFRLQVEFFDGIVGIQGVGGNQGAGIGVVIRLIIRPADIVWREHQLHDTPSISVYTSCTCFR